MAHRTWQTDYGMRSSINSNGKHGLVEVALCMAHKTAAQLLPRPVPPSFHAPKRRDNVELKSAFEVRKAMR